MKISLHWLQDFIEIPAEISISKIAYDLTMSTVEVEEVHDLSKDFDNIHIGVIKDIRPHPDADKLVLCQVDIGDTDESGNPLLREVVCGGINLRKEMKVAAARPGAKVRWHGEGDLIELKTAKVRGAESYGMICASSEIGLFDLFPYTEEATIADLSGFDAPAGTPLAKALGIDDVILTIDNKSLTNRPDLWGHYGIARELAAIYNLPLKDITASSLELAAIYNLPLKDITANPLERTAGNAVPSVPADPLVFKTTPAGNFKINIEDPALCPRYIGIIIENVSPVPSPFEIQTRLWRVGERPINAIVDITNYVMLETGQPTHAFDADVVCGNINIRRAVSGETLTLLSGKTLTLTSDDLVIADSKEPIALAGVMGGEKDSVLPDTKRVILEIANFNALSVRKTAIRYDTRTEAAARFEKNIDPPRADIALASAARLFIKLFPGLKVTATYDNYPSPPKPVEISLSLNWLERRLGRRLPQEQINSILHNLGFKVSAPAGSAADDIINITVPAWRATGDISIPDDIIEEIARIYGFENFDPAPIVTSFERAINQPDVDIDRKIREYLALSCGMNEIYTYPWVDEEYITAILGSDRKNMLELSAPPSPAERFLRTSLIPGLCKATAENLRYFSEFAVFESAQVFFDEGYSPVYDERESLPLQRRHVAGAFVSSPDSYTALFRHLKGILEDLPRRLHTGQIKLLPQTQDTQCIKPYWADDVIYLKIMSHDSKIGDLGLLSQKSALACGIKNAAVMLFEFNIDALRPLPSRENIYKRMPEYPITKYDISLLFDKQIKWSDIESAARGKPGPDNFLRDVSFFEEYTGKHIPDGKKSVTLRLLIGSDRKTLNSDEIEACAASVAKRLAKNLSAVSR